MTNDEAALNKATYDYEHDDKLYRFSPLTFKDQSSLLLWAKMSEYHWLKESLGDSPSEADQEALEKVRQACWNKEKPSPTDLAQLETFEGVKRVFLYSLRTHQPGITLAEVEALISRDTMNEIGEAIARMSFTKQDQGGSGASQKKIRSQRRIAS